jgi:hypothetical protein
VRVIAMLLLSLVCASAAAAQSAVVGIMGLQGADSESWNQIIVLSSGDTFLSGYLWPSYLQDAWVPGVNIFASAGAGGAQVADVSGSLVLSRDGKIFQPFHASWVMVDDIPLSLGNVVSSPFVALYAGGAWSGSGGNFPYAMTADGTIYRMNTRNGSNYRWQVTGQLPGAVPAVRATWTDVKLRFQH